MDGIVEVDAAGRKELQKNAQRLDRAKSTESKI